MIDLAGPVANTPEGKQALDIPVEMTSFAAIAPGNPVNTPTPAGRKQLDVMCWKSAPKK
ncbi:MAG: hypothetical protein ACSLFB_14230 [Acidimicrobiales bacterium]